MANHSAFSKQAVVAGAGPVGTLTAIALAKQGWQVQVKHCCAANFCACTVVLHDLEQLAWVSDAPVEVQADVCITRVEILHCIL